MSNIMRSFFYRLLGVILLCMISTVMLAGTGNALCVKPFEEGEWVEHPDYSSHFLPKLNIRFICQDQVRNGEIYPPGPPFYIHVYGACKPTLCDWGEAEAYYSGDWLKAIYRRWYVTRTVWVKQSSSFPDMLYIVVFNDFHDGRTDRWISSHLIRREKSCIDRCGMNSSDGSCWGDSLCESFGDCCVDKIEQCGP